MKLYYCKSQAKGIAFFSVWQSDGSRSRIQDSQKHRCRALEQYLRLKTVQILLQIFLSRSSRSHMFFKISVLKNFATITGKHLCWNLFLIKLQTGVSFLINLQARSPETLLKRDSITGVFLWILRIAFIQNTCGGCFHLSYRCLRGAWLSLR